MGEGLGPWELGDFTAAKPKCIHSQTPINPCGPRLGSNPLPSSNFHKGLEDLFIKINTIFKES